MPIDSTELYENLSSKNRSNTAEHKNSSSTAGSRTASFTLSSATPSKLPKVIGTIDIGADFIAVTAAVFLAYSAYCGLQLGRHASYPISQMAIVACSVALFYVLMLRANGAYTLATSLLRVRETERVIAASSQLCFFAFAVSFWAELHFSRLVFLIAAVLIPMLVLAEKQAIYVFVHSLYARKCATRRTVVYGGGLSGKRALTVLARSPKLGLNPIAVVDNDANLIGTNISESAYTPSRCLKVLPGPVTAEMLRKLSAEVVVISSPSINAETFAQIGGAAAAAGATLLFVPYDNIIHNAALSYWNADGLIFASVEEQQTGTIYGHLKRAFDFSVALLMLGWLFPLLIAIGVAIRWTSHGPALFKQERVGKNGRKFALYKFRTMDVAAPQYALSPTSSLDPRITKIGAFLRRTSLDEIPQLLNVLKGDMSLVGPRPEMPFIVEQYNALHRQRLRVEQGITGLWQISADRAHSIHENIQYDLYYIHHRNFFMDLAILLHTIVFAMRGI
jgi:exopolysaccharide biosynthesis polyprenyl glycosylphosphotransferase